MNLPSLSAPRFAGRQMVVGTSKAVAQLKDTLAKTDPNTPVAIIETPKGILADLKTLYGAQLKPAGIDTETVLPQIKEYLASNPDLAEALETLAADTLGKGITRKTDLTDLTAVEVLTGEDAKAYQAVEPEFKKVAATLIELSKDLNQVVDEMQISPATSFKQSATHLFQGIALEAFGKLIQAGIISPSAVRNFQKMMEEDLAVAEAVGKVVEAFIQPNDAQTRQQAINTCLDAVLPQLAATPKMAEAVKFALNQFTPLIITLAGVYDNPKTLGQIIPKLPIPVTVQTLKAAVKKSGLAPETGAPLVPHRTIKCDAGVMLTVLGHLGAAAKAQQAGIIALSGKLKQLKSGGAEEKPASNTISLNDHINTLPKKQQDGLRLMPPEEAQALLQKVVDRQGAGIQITIPTQNSPAPAPKQGVLTLEDEGSR